MGMKLSDYVAKQPTSSVSVNNTVGTTPTQSFVSGSSLLGGAPTLSPSPKSATETQAETPKVGNKNSGLEIIGRGLAALPGSIAKGTTSAIDKITDTPSYVGKLFADSTKGKVTGGYYEAAKANAAYEKARDTHVLGQGVQNWQNKVDARRDQIVLDNPNSKVAEYTGKALQLGEAAGEMLPTVAASALVGGLGVAAVGGKGAIAAAEAAQSLGVASKAAKALSTASKIGEAAGLGVMAMDVYAKSVDESTKQGYDFVQSSKKAFGDAVLEIGTEMMFGGIAGLGEGVVSRVSKNVINRNLAAAAASEGAEQAVKMLGVEKAVLATAGLVNRVSAFAASTPGRRLVTSMLGEGAEEMVSEFFGPYIERMTTNPNADNATLGQMIEAGVGGALLSFFMSPLGKLQDSIGKPDADVVEKARTILKLQDADMNLTLARNLAFDSISDEDVPVIEQLLGRTVEPGTSFIRGLAARNYEAVYQDRLSKALVEAEQSGKTPEAMSRMWREFAEVFDQVSIDRADEVAAEIHNSTTVAQAADNSKAVLSAREAVNAAKEKLAKAQEAADKALADKTNKSTGYAKAVADAKQELSRAQAALQEAEDGARKSVELRLSKSDAVERFGKEAVDNFSAAQRVREVKAGRFYAADENGAERIYTRDQYASEKFGGKRYSQLTAKQKAVVDKAQADYQAKIKAELDAWSTKINEAIKSRGLGDKLRVEISDGHKFSVGYNNGAIHFSTDRVHTTQAADYYLAHEFTHAVEDKLFTTVEQKADFRKVLNGAMQTVGFDHDRWYARLEALYKNDYLPAIRAEAKRKGVKDIEGYVEKELYERIESEVYARFMQTAFGSESILQSLAVFSPDLVEQMRNSIDGSSVAELTDSLWDYERMCILERIDRAIAAPTDAETNKEKNAEAAEQAFKDIDETSGNLYNADKNNTGGNEDARSRRYYVTKHSGRGEGSRTQSDSEKKDLGGPGGLFSEDYENKRSALLERARGLRTLRDGAKIGAVTHFHEYGPRVYRYVENTEDLPGTIMDTMSDMNELSRFSVSAGKLDLIPLFVLNEVRVSMADGTIGKAGGLYDPTDNVIIVPFDGYEDEYYIPDSRIIRHEQTHAVQHLIPESYDLFLDELYSSSGFSARELNGLITDYYKYHLRSYGDELDRAEMLYNELFSDLMAGRLGKLPKRYLEPLLSFRERFAPVLTQFVNERGLNVNFTDWLKPTKTELEEREIDAEITRLDKSLFRGAVAEWASDNGFDIDDLDFYPNGPELYVVPKQASEILSVDDIMGVPRSEYVATFFADTDEVGPYLEETSSGVMEPPIYPDEMFFRSVDSDAEFSEEKLRQYEELKRKYFKDIDETSGNLYNLTTNSGVRNNETASDSRANLRGSDVRQQGRNSELRREDGRRALGIGEEDQGGSRGRESTERSAREVVAKWADKESVEVERLIESFGGEDAFADAFLKLYDQGPIVAETWSDFFTDVESAIRELDDLYGKNSYSFFRSVDSDAEFSEEQLRQYEELKRKYGKDDFGTPNKINDHSATSRFASRLIGNEANIWDVDENGNKTMTGVRTPEELQEAMKRELLNGVYTHIVHTDEAAMTAAKSRMLYHEEYTKKGNAKKTVQHKTLADAYSYARGMLESGRALNKNDIAFAQQLIVDMTDRYNQIEAGKNPVQGESTDTTELFNQLQELIALTCAAGTRAGQNLQAFSLLKKMTPQGRLFYIEQQSNQIISELVDRRGESRVGGYRYQKDDLGRYKTDANGRPVPITIRSELRTKMLNCTSTEELDAVEKEIISDIASQIGPTITDRVVAWRYLAMLGNPRTHVRNIVSNTAMGVSVQLKNAIGGVLEDQILSGKTTGRTKTAKQVDPATRKALLDFADNDWTQDSVNEIALSGGKIGFQNRINEERRKLGTEKFHPLDTVSKKNTELLEKADDMAAKRAYKRAFAGYAAANGLGVEYLGAGTVESNTALAQARSYAIKEAAKATYHDASDVATMLNELEKKSGLAGKIVVGGLVPFKKTPVNILKRGVEYSPLGLLSGITKTVRALNTVTEDIYEVDGKKVTKSVYESEYGGKGGRFVKPADYDAAYTATTSADALDTKTSNKRYSAEAQKTKAVADAIDQMAAGLTGTGLMIIGLLLAKLGMMSGAGSDNDDEKYYDEMTGTQEYSITIGNTNYTLDWLTPVSMPMFAGVALWELFSPDEEVDFPDLLTAVSKLADPVMNLSVLQGVNDAISSYDSGLGKAVLSSAESFAGQFIPTLSGQLARSVDPTRRTTYAPKDSNNLFGKEGATFLNRMKNKIPGLSQKNAAYVDQWGRTEESDSGFIGRLFANSVNPSYTRQTNKTQADDYISMLLNQTGDRTVIPKSPDANYVFGDDKFYLTSDEYQTTKQLVGQISNVGVTSLLSVPGFAQLSADEQADLVSDIYSFARKVAKADYAVANGLSYTEESSVVRIKNAVAAGMSIGAAMYVNYIANSMTADKDANGKSISGSKKAKVLNLYTMMGLTQQQIEAISIYDTN